MNTDQLIHECIKQNRQAQADLYNLYKKPLYGLCLKYCANAAEAEDNLHNSFIEIFMNIKKFNNNGSFEGWMKKITINKAIDSFKKNCLLMPIENDFVDEIITIERNNDCTLDQLLLMIQELPPQYRLVFCMYELDDFSHQEIAEKLAISENTSKSNLHRAKLLLKSKINKLHQKNQN